MPKKAQVFTLSGSIPSLGDEVTHLQIKVAEDSLSVKEGTAVVTEVMEDEESPSGYSVGILTEEEICQTTVGDRVSVGYNPVYAEGWDRIFGAKADSQLN